MNTVLKEINWLRIFLYYAAVLGATYLVRKLPNLLSLLLKQITDIPFSFNYNHGMALLLLSVFFYSFFPVNKQVTFWGNSRLKSLLFPLVLFMSYGIYGIPNNHGINPHLWAILFCSLAMLYNIMEEYAWRGYLINNLEKTPLWFKSLLSGLFWGFWHLLVFENFDQYGGFLMFLLFCIVFSFILTFAVHRTASVLVAAAIHTFLVQMNVATLVCFVLFMILLGIWNRISFVKKESDLSVMS